MFFLVKHPSDPKLAVDLIGIYTEEEFYEAVDGYHLPMHNHDGDLVIDHYNRRQYAKVIQMTIDSYIDAFDALNDMEDEDTSDNHLPMQKT